jgi:hypothetical protein
MSKSQKPTTRQKELAASVLNTASFREKPADVFYIDNAGKVHSYSTKANGGNAVIIDNSGKVHSFDSEATARGPIIISDLDLPSSTQETEKSMTVRRPPTPQPAPLGQEYVDPYLFETGHFESREEYEELSRTAKIKSRTRA